MVVLKQRFKDELKAIFDFIALDSKARAKSFRDEMFEQMETIQDNPYMYRKSTKFSDENIRDFIFKGYVIPYLIDTDTILILGIYKANLWK